MKWTKLALTTMTLATLGLCFTACDEPPPLEADSDGEYESDDLVRSLHTGFLELDGNAVTTATDDWDEVFNRADSALASTFISEALGENSTFTGGGSKDINDVSSWRHTNGSTPDKNNILDAYAATYTDAEGHKVLYFGADRFSVEGDAQLGFWFFQDTVATGPGGRFTGVHQNNDVLVLVNFTKGGTTPNVEVFRWDDSVANNLVVVAPGTPARCGAAAQEACAITNDTGPVESPWEYTPKSGPSGMFPEEAFFEGGIDLTALVPNSDLCFASFLAETRSSTSETAVLKDFVLGGFEDCEAVVELTPTCDSVTIQSDGTCAEFEVTFSGRICNDSTGLDSDLTNIIVTGPAGQITLSDDAGDGANRIASGDCETFTAEKYTTAEVNSSDPGAVIFDADVRLQATGPGNVPVDITESFDEPCPLCPE